MTVYPPEVRAQLDVAHARERLVQVNALSTDFIPEGCRWPELAELRAEHVAFLDQLRRMTALEAALAGEFQEEDAAYNRKLRESMDLRSSAPDDARTPPAERDERLKPLREQSAAALLALDEFVTRTIDTIREREDEWLAELRDDLPTLEAKRQEAQRIFQEARGAEWRLAAWGQWLQAKADRTMGALVPEEGAPAPERWQLQPNQLERHWSQLRPWSRAYTGDRDVADRVAAIAAQNEDDDTLDGTDGVFPLSDTGAAA